ncbi:MAG: hypothetical protein H0V35_09580, partial [Nitrospira sp.]|nr:hypothetical protein [Nitrospira sp.]
VAYHEDTDRVIEVMQAVGEELRRDGQFGPLMIEPIEVVGDRELCRLCRDPPCPHQNEAARTVEHRA